MCTFWHVELPKHETDFPNAAIGSSWSGSHAPSSTPEGRWRHLHFNVMSDSEEVWRDIEGYEGWYQVSNHGRVRSLDRTVHQSDGTTRDFEGTVLTPNTQIVYESVQLHHEDKDPKRFLVHRLVAQAFIPNPNNKPEVNHLDGDKQNNHVSNLEWVTRSENFLHAYAEGIRDKPNVPTGEGNPNASLTNTEAKHIRDHPEKDAEELADRFGVSVGTVRRIWQGARYFHGESVTIPNRGENSHYSKVGKPEVREIRARYENEDVSYADLADGYSVGRGAVGMIVRRETWKHVE